MSIYSTGAEGIRDTTKWLVTFVPVAALLAAGAVTGARLLDDMAVSDSFTDGVKDHLWPLAGLAVVVIGVAMVIRSGAHVLSTAPKNFGDVFTNEEKLSRAFSAGVGAPYFLDDEGFRNALAELDKRWHKNEEVTGAELARAVSATDSLREWALFEELRSSFNSFQRSFWIGLFVIGLGLIVARTTLAPAIAEIEEPRVVSIAVSQDGADDLLASTGCSQPSETRFLAAGGTWGAPVLEPDGPGCRFGARWHPDPDHIEVRIPSED